MIRAFFALPVSVTLEQQLTAQRYHLEEQLFREPLRWVPAQNYHITLAFLGDISGRDIPKLESIARDVAKHHQSSLLTVNDIAWFPSVDKPRLLAALINDSSLLDKLQQDLLRQLRQQGFELERRKFRPHITLARAGWGAQAQPFTTREETNEQGMVTDMDELVLFESQLLPDGSYYQPLLALLLGE